ncbi:MAG: DUF2959 domain-containing protein [Kiritimatiellae bacterium]|nr:DUF2959 domain-containing protein [Kiritimatiellia bacterium]
MRNRILSIVSALLLVPLAGCCLLRPFYYKAMSAFGKEKRDLLVSRVLKARDAQQDTQKVFKDALEQFSSVVHFDGGNLQKEYDRLSKELDRCEGRAADVKSRIDAVEQVSKDLFKEWKSEIGQYQNAEYRRDSEKKLRETRANCDRMLAAMRSAQERIEPVLSVFRDQVLYLKHNLNARAIASLQGESARIETDVARLVDDLGKAIEEANRFIAEIAQ